ncbi:MAG: S-methyl-5'-thioadenosine phosphorylase [Anaerolineaceae bacterium]
MNTKPNIAVIGGTGIYQMDSLKDVETIEMNTPYGAPSSAIVIGSIEDKRVAFLARHGIGHVLLPSEVNYRANIYALKMIGVKRIISITACGSLREDFAPGHIVIPDQIIDFTRNRKNTFFGDGLVAHISSADPFCNTLSGYLYHAVSNLTSQVHRGGTFITIEGPRFSTKAESNLYRSWGITLIGMTASPEAFLAREAEMCYASMAHVTDYDSWHQSEETVSVEMVVRTLNQNKKIAQESIYHLIQELPDEIECNCDSALENALITNPEYIPVETRNNLDWIIGKYLKS